jgi:hypothetical protein
MSKTPATKNNLYWNTTIDVNHYCKWTGNPGFAFGFLGIDVKIIGTRILPSYLASIALSQIV